MSCFSNNNRTIFDQMHFCFVLSERFKFECREYWLDWIRSVESLEEKNKNASLEKKFQNFSFFFSTYKREERDLFSELTDVASANEVDQVSKEIQANTMTRSCIPNIR